MATGSAVIGVLTYHSISAAAGPTSISPATFRMHLDVLAARGVRGLTCAEFIAWHEGHALDGPRVLITFDDAYADFAAVAHPALAAHGFPALVFAPTARIGGVEAWRGAQATPRALLDWDTMRGLAGQGVEFGGHGVTHVDLTGLGPQEREAEIDGCADALEEHLGVRPIAFAAPYGHADAAVRAAIGRTYRVAFGTRFDRATRACDRHDVPRIEMHYFRDRRRWSAFVDGANGYFAVRKALRAVRLGVLGATA